MKYRFILLATLFLVQCSSPGSKKMEPATPAQIQDYFNRYADSSIRTQSFILDNHRDTLLLTDHCLLFIPAHNFENAQGETVINPVRIEFREIHSSADAWRQGLTTVTEKNEMLQTAGMFFIQVTDSKTNELLRYKKTIRVETGNPLFSSDIQVYRAALERDKLSWIDPKPTEKTMIPMPLDIFYDVPYKQEGFYWDHNTPQKKLTQMPDMRPDATCLAPSQQLQRILKMDSAAFSKTWIATREFKTRLLAMDASCNHKVLTLYVENIDKMLWEVDAMAADLLAQTQNKQASTFRRFAELKNTGLADLQAGAKLPDSLLYVFYLQQPSSTTIPISFVLSGNGLVNLDCQLEGREGIEMVQLTAVPILQNAAPDVIVQGLLLLQGTGTVVGLDNQSDKWTASIRNCPVEQPALVILKFKNGTTIGLAELVINKESLQVDVPVFSNSNTAEVQRVLLKYTPLAKYFCIDWTAAEDCCY